MNNDAREMVQLELFHSQLAYLRMFVCMAMATSMFLRRERIDRSRTMLHSWNKRVVNDKVF